MADRMPVIDDDSRQDRHHGQDTGGEAEQQAETEEAGQDQPVTPLAEQGGDPRSFVCHRGHSWHGRRRRCRAYGRHRTREKADGRLLRRRRIADPLIPAPLRDGLEHKSIGARGIEQRNADAHLVVIDVHLAEEIVFLGFAGWKCRVAQADRSRFGRKTKFFAVEIVAVGNLPTRLDRLGVDSPGGKPVSLLRLQGFCGKHRRHARTGQQKVQQK